MITFINSLLKLKMTPTKRITPLISIKIRYTNLKQIKTMQREKKSIKIIYIKVKKDKLDK